MTVFAFLQTQAPSENVFIEMLPREVSVFFFKVDLFSFKVNLFSVKVDIFYFKVNLFPLKKTSFQLVSDRP